MESFRGAILNGVDFRGVDLSFADFTGAELKRTNFTGARLTGAKLSSADTSQAIGLATTSTEAFEIETGADGTLLGYKLVDENFQGIFYRDQAMFYRVGAFVQAKKVQRDPFSLCGEGINLATIAWCQATRKTLSPKLQKGSQIVVAAFTKGDLAVIPKGSTGKYRVERCLVLRTLEEL